MLADPERFDITRSPNPHVGFGSAGPHFCLGAHLARREISAMLRELLTRVPDIRAADEPDRLLSSFHQRHQAPALRVRLTNDPTAGDGLFSGTRPPDPSRWVRRRVLRVTDMEEVRGSSPRRPTQSNGCL